MDYCSIPLSLWQRIKEILPTEGSPKGGRPCGDLLTFITALLWILKTGAPWRALPERFGSWKTVYSRFRRWLVRGYFDAMFSFFTATESDLETVMIDGSYVHVHQHASGARGGSAKQAIGVSRGGKTTKIHAVVDALGNLLKFVITAGNVSDYREANGLLEEFHDCEVLADKGYDSTPLVEQLEEQACTVVIPSRSTRLRPRPFDRYAYRGRHLIENFFQKVKAYRRVGTRYDKLSEVFGGFVTLAAVFIWQR